MNTKQILLSFLIISIAFSTQAQTFERFEAPVIFNQQQLTNPWAGGINAVQYYEVDLNRDSLMDLVGFDRIGDIFLPFVASKNDTEVSYIYDSQYLESFPDLVGWVVFIDYNMDGITDIFSYPVNAALDGIEVYKGSLVQNKLAFEQVLFPARPNDVIYFDIPSGGQAQVYVTDIDVPAILDVDEDGDVDLLTFNFGGGYIDFFRNLSIENGYPLDSLVFFWEDTCWGGLFESGISTYLDLAPNAGGCAPRFSPDDAQVTLRHAGSTVAAFDMDNDCDKEIFLGDISFDHIIMGINEGTCSDAWISAQDTFFPSKDESVNLPSYPASFFVDVNGDGLKDYVATRNAENGGEDYNTSWYYKNIGDIDQAEFSLQKKTFLVDEMLDFGTGAHPAFVDYNADGLMDLVISNESYFAQNGAAKDSRLQLFENIGTAETPVFELVDEDWLNFSIYNPTPGNSNGTWSFTPTFGDLDGDGDEDLLVGCENGSLFYCENLAGIGQPLNFANTIINWLDIDVGRFSAPAMGDFNKDGLMDLVVGEFNVRLNYFQNKGSIGNPSFDPEEQNAPNSEFFGQIDLREGFFYTLGYGSPVVLDFGDSTLLATGHESGTVWLYGGIGTPTDAFQLLDEDFGQLNQGEKTYFDFADLDGDDKLEIIIGNERGGLGLFKTNLRTDGRFSTSTKDESLSQLDFELFPNPSTNFLNIRFNRNMNSVYGVRIVDLYGKTHFNRKYISSEIEIPVNFLTNGVYFVQIQTDSGLESRKFIKN